MPAVNTLQYDIMADKMKYARIFFRITFIPLCFITANILSHTDRKLLTQKIKLEKPSDINYNYTMRTFQIMTLIIFYACVSMAAAEKFDHRAILWYTPEKEIVLVIDYYTTKADILMQIDWKKIKGMTVTLEHNLIFLIGLKQVKLPLKTYTRDRHKKIIKIGTIFHKKDEEILLQNGINWPPEPISNKSDKQPYKNFGVPGF